MRFLAGLILSASFAFAGGLHAGAAQVIITPPQGAPMAGYYSNRAATGVHDDLHAKAIVFEKDGVKVTLVACDMVSIPRPIVDEARSQIQRTLNIPPSHVMISATHSHTGPVILGGPSRYNLEGEMKEIAVKYTAELPGKIAEAAQKANAALSPVRIRSGIGREDSLAFNRRFHMKNGTVGWNPGKLNPNIVRPAGSIDGSVPVVFVESTSGKPVAAYVNYAVHLDTFGGTQYSADYAYPLGKILSAAKGNDLLTLFTIGTAGNINHIDVSTKAPQKGAEESARIGAVLAAEVLKTVKQAPLVDVSDIRVSTKTLKLQLPEIRPGQVEWARKIAVTFGKPNAAPFNDLVRAFKIIETAERKGKLLDAEVQVIALGNQIAFAALPGEIFVELGMTIKNGSPFPQTIIPELANGSVGYVPDRKAYAQGAYEVESARCAVGSGELMVDSAIQQLIDLYAKHQK